jgi:DNA-directed RNA polymerase specialized sigma24 family protein
VVLSLPDYHHCVVPGAACFAEWQSCRAEAAAPQAAPAPAPADAAAGNANLEALLDLLGGADAPPETRAILRQSFQELSPEELAQMLQMYRQTTGQQ